VQLGEACHQAASLGRGLHAPSSCNLAALGARDFDNNTAYQGALYSAPSAISKTRSEVKMYTRILLIVPLLVSLAYPRVASAVDEDLKVVFNTHCRNCHSYKKGDNRLGPSLYGIVGNKAGEVAGYNAYSGSLKGITWDEATLDRFIAKPTSVAPSTNMNYPPVADAATRKKIIRFLRSTSAP